MVYDSLRMFVGQKSLCHMYLVVIHAISFAFAACIASVMGSVYAKGM